MQARAQLVRDLLRHPLARHQRGAEVQPCQIRHPAKEGRDRSAIQAEFRPHRGGRLGGDQIIAIAPGSDAKGGIARQRLHHQEGQEPHHQRDTKRLRQPEAQLRQRPAHWEKAIVFSPKLRS
uniref:Uncharacterized protein n=1 Tax=Cereibacter sphaeroides (strain ATCC 17025 / ATH 2.4.3) TaxID=349102 RepID=A4WY03_CERS5